jgi:hypothetical protein
MVLLNKNELRIGNLLNPRGIVAVWSIQKITDNIIINELPDFDYEPIPLLGYTDEWLTKLGWLKSDKSGETRTIYYHPTTGLFELIRKNDFSSGLFACRSNSGIHNILISERIMYVHQLQNIYFFLTSGELIFNL